MAPVPEEARVDRAGDRRPLEGAGGHPAARILGDDLERAVAAHDDDLVDRLLDDGGVEDVAVGLDAVGHDDLGGHFAHALFALLDDLVVADVVVGVRCAG